MLNRNNSSITYELESANYHNPNERFNRLIGYNEFKNRNSVQNLFYYPNINELCSTEKNFYSHNNYFNTNLSSYYKSLNNSKNNIYKNENYKSNNSQYNNINNNFKKEDINFNKNTGKKITLKYQYKNISPSEITDKTKELINLQSQMCKLNSTIDNSSKKKSRPKSASKYSSQSNFNNKSSNSNFESLPVETSFNKSKKKIKIKKNKSFNSSYGANKSSTLNNSRMSSKMNTFGNSKKDDTWKNKYLKIKEEIKSVKNKIKEIKNNNNEIEKRLNNIKEKEEKKNIIYENNDKIEKYNIKLLKKYQLSEVIRQKQIDLIIKMQKEVNNMREKLQLLNQNN